MSTCGDLFYVQKLADDFNCTSHELWRIICSERDWDTSAHDDMLQ
jgi:hypothetical protein